MDSFLIETGAKRLFVSNFAVKNGEKTTIQREAVDVGRYLGSAIIKPNRFSVEWNDIVASTQRAQCVL